MALFFFWLYDISPVFEDEIIWSLTALKIWLLWHGTFIMESEDNLFPSLKQHTYASNMPVNLWSKKTGKPFCCTWGLIFSLSIPFCFPVSHLWIWIVQTSFKSVLIALYSHHELVEVILNSSTWIIILKSLKHGWDLFGLWRVYKPRTNYQWSKQSDFVNIFFCPSIRISS